MAPAIVRQSWILFRKNLIINLRRHHFTTVLRAFILPVIFVSFLSYARNLGTPPGKYGVGKTAPIRSLPDALAAESQYKIVFVNNGLGGEVDELISSLEEELKGKGVVKVLEKSDDLRTECRQSLMGSSDCFGAVVFTDSPNTGNRTSWAYTLRGDVAYSIKRLNVDNHNNPIQKFLLPLQLAVDRAIAKAEGYNGPDMKISEYQYTDMNQEEYEKWLRSRFSGAVINFLSAAYLIGMIGIVYHLVGFQAMEREKGLSTLIEAMGGSKFARIISYHTSFSAMYIIGWVVMALNMWGGILNRTSPVIIIIWHIVSGWALASWALLLGSVFKKAQLSGISATVLSLGLGIVAQVSKDAGTGAYAILSLLFPPMNYVFFLISLGRWEGEEMGASLIKAAPGGNNSSFPLVGFWVFSLIQVFAFTIAAAYVERYLFGTASPRHRHFAPQSTSGTAVQLRGFTKRYPPRLLTKIFGQHKDTVLAVDDLNLEILQGQIMVLLGANGSGKTTTLEAVAGLASIKEGDINICTDGSIGICPQKNVLWDDLTVEEHVRIWNRIKCTGDSVEDQRRLIEECDLTLKKHAKSKTLSGGQKRKLQLAAMFTGGSTVCCIDEVSSGLDPLSRRKIWDIILAAKGIRTILMTSHFLDEADLLADHIAILSKGKLKCDGSAVFLKTQYGGGYRVHAPITAPELKGFAMKRFYDATIYNAPNASEANRLVALLEGKGISDYYVAGPSIEDVFLKVADENIAHRSETAGTSPKERLNVTEGVGPISTATSHANSHTDESENAGIKLDHGKPTSIFQQIWALIRKRFTVLQRGYLPTIAAICIPIIAAGITQVTFDNYEGTTCAPEKRVSVGDIESFSFDSDINLVAGPPDKISLDRLSNLSSILSPVGSSGDSINSTLMESILSSINTVDSLGDFNQYIKDNYKNVTPGGIFLEDNGATVAWVGNSDLALTGVLALLSVVDNLLLGVEGGIRTQYQAFDYEWRPGQGRAMLFTVYMCLVFAAYPAFFALYPTVERIKRVRALHYSNGVRALPLWLAYTLFDFAAVLFISIVCLGLFAAATSSWYGFGYLFIIMILYGLASITLVYCISLITKSQLSAFAFAAGGQASMFLIYFIIFMSILTYAKPEDTERMNEIALYVLCAVSPIVSMLHAFFVATNSFSVACDGNTLIAYPGEFKLYGCCITFLIFQIILLFSLIVLHDSGKLSIGGFSFRKSSSSKDPENNTFSEKDITDELHRVSSSNDGLRVRHLSKKFKDFQAVDDVTFGVPRGEVFALLGPNGAGKTTTINMIRGELPPTSGEIFVQNVLVNKNRAEARTHLGVCPQFDAMDRMTVTEHLIFYARIRGLDDVQYNVDAAIRAVGLDEFRYRTAEKLSGGNKRKLSLAIALMGNPAVLLLDEPSSGMDAAAKRVMWRTLETVAPGRSMVLTTHSMEECSALASRAGILAKRMLALGTTEQLRRRYGDKYLVHVVLKSAPNSAPEEMNAVKNWISISFPGAEIEQRSFGGQVRFSIPAHVEEDGGERNSVGTVFKKLEKEGPAIGLEFWSVDRGTMDMVFLDVVGRAAVREEGYDNDAKRRKWKMIATAIFCPWMFLIR